MALPTFYLKINTNTEFAVKCFEHWVEIVEAYGADYYVVCDNEDLCTRISNDVKPHNIIPSSENARALIKDMVAPFWLNAGTALLTPFFHAKENGISSFFNIDADDTVMCCEAGVCAKVLMKARTYADNTEISCFSLDIHSSAVERYFPCWTFGVTYVKNNVDYIHAINQFTTLRERIGAKNLIDENIDEVFSVLGNESVIETGSFYIENLYFRHQNWETHYYENGYFRYKNISNFTRKLWRIKDFEIECGLKIPDRFIKIDADILHKDCLTFLNSNDIFSMFTGDDWLDFDIEKIKYSINDGTTKLILFGAGRAGYKALYLLREEGCDVSFFCDNSEKLWGKMIKNIRVINFDELLEIKQSHSVCVVITTIVYRNEIEQQLLRAGITAIN